MIQQQEIFYLQFSKSVCEEKQPITHLLNYIIPDKTVDN